uniref:Uncharacterized protein n=1 Tax=Octopus bimaculoides TaxID=37653 RepID=A0A0L8I7G3_OCTBM
MLRHLKRERPQLKVSANEVSMDLRYLGGSSSLPSSMSHSVIFREFINVTVIH